MIEGAGLVNVIRHLGFFFYSFRINLFLMTRRTRIDFLTKTATGYNIIVCSSYLKNR